MRIIERLQYLAGLLYYLQSLIHHTIPQWTLFGLIIFLLVVGFYFEGFRVHQLPFILGFLIEGIVFVFTEPPLAIDIIALALNAFSIVLMLLFGEVNFSRMKNEGPYQVGYKEFRTFKLDNPVSVFYPINKEHYKQMIKKNNTKWLRNGDHTLLGIAKASAEYGSDDHISIHIFRHLRKIMMDIVFNGELDGDFYERPLTPIIYCHGLCSNRTMHSGTARDFASHGYIVFAMDHKDSTSSYVDDKNGTHHYYDNKHLAYDYDRRREQIKIRENEVITFIDEL